MDLSTVELIKNFKPEEREKFREVIETLELKAGDTLFNEGDPGDSLVIIYRGSVRIFKQINTETGEEKSLALLEQGSYLGEMSLLEGTPRSASARAETDCEILTISRKNFIKMLHNFPQAAVRLFVSFMNVLSERLRRTDEELVVLYEVGKIIGDSPPLNELLGGILRCMVNALKVKTGVVFIPNEFNCMLEVREAMGEDAETVKQAKMKDGEGIIGLSLRENRMICTQDFENEEAYSGVKRFGFERARMIVAPLARGDHPFGALLLSERMDGKPFDNANLNLVHAVANQAAAAIEAALFHKDSDQREKFCRKYLRF